MELHFGMLVITERFNRVSWSPLLEEPPNNGMHPTANSVAFMRETWVVSRLDARRVMPGVRRRVEAYNETDEIYIA
jgi:hypothetical protein